MKSKNGWNISWKTARGPLVFLAIFLAIGIWRYLATGKVFFIFNFGYIGGAIAVGSFLNHAMPRKHVLWGRRISQILVASYFLVYLGVVRRENMQIEGFFFYLLAGVFAAATLHYFIAKVVGTFLLNRGWCGWACWTAMLLDLLPFRRNEAGRLPRRWGYVRYVHFALSLGLVLLLWLLGYSYEMEGLAELYWLVAGNLLYYTIAVVLAYALKDNRAFCKYVCPIPVLQKIGARFAVWRMRIDPDKCTDCGICEKRCPMDIKMLEYKNAGQRTLSTECIICFTCVNVCPRSAIKIRTGFDMARAEHLRYRDE